VNVARQVVGIQRALEGLPRVVVPVIVEHYERETGQPMVRPTDWLGAPFIVGNASWIRIN
jgi:hypothetical protein